MNTENRSPFRNYFLECNGGQCGQCGIQIWFVEEEKRIGNISSLSVQELGRQKIVATLAPNSALCYVTIK